MVIPRRSIPLNGNASLYPMQCLSVKFNLKEARTGDLKVSFNHTLSSLCLFWDLSVFFFVHVFIFSFPFLFVRKWQYFTFTCQKDFLLQFYPSLFRTPFTIIPLGSRNLIGVQYLTSHKMYSLTLTECLQILLVGNFGKGFRNAI